MECHKSYESWNVVFSFCFRWGRSAVIKMNTCDNEERISCCSFSKCLHMYSPMENVLGCFLFFGVVLMCSSNINLVRFERFSQSTRIHQEKANAHREEENCSLYVIVNGILCVSSPSLRMIYVLWTIKRMFGYHSSPCSFIMTFLVLIRSTEEGISRFIFGHFYLLVLISNPFMGNVRAGVQSAWCIGVKGVQSEKGSVMADNMLSYD